MYMYMCISLVREVCLCDTLIIMNFSLQEGKRLQFQELTQLMRDLLDRRRQIQSKTLPRVGANWFIDGVAC